MLIFQQIVNNENVKIIMILQHLFMLNSDENDLRDRIHAKNDVIVK